MPREAIVLDEGHDAMWDEFVVSHPLGRGAVTSASRRWWGADGWSLHIIGLLDAGRLLSGAAVITKRIPHTSRRLARIEALMADPTDMEGSVVPLLRRANDLCRSMRCLEIESRLLIPEGVLVKGHDFYEITRHVLGEQGYTGGVFRQATYLARVDLDDEQLARSFSDKCRRDVRRGLTRGVTVEELRAPEDLRLLLEERGKMAQRKGIESLSESAYEAMLPMFERGHFRAFSANYDGRPRNMVLIDALGLPRGLFGGVTAAAFEKGVPPTGQPLHYCIMRWLRDRGARFYDLGGSPGPVPVEGHPNYTVWRFKHEFGAPYVYMLPYHRKSLSRLGGLGLALARKVRRLPS